MNYMVKFTLKPNSKNALMDHFDLRGPNRNPGVKFVNAWIGKDADVVFALVEGDREDQLQAAGASWSQFGEFEVFPVTDVQAF
jgi:hypothetical protein